MIIGIGIDICRISRIAKTFKNFPKLTTKILHENEITEQISTNFLAKIWTVKEAFSKATGLGLSKIGFKNIVLKKNALGAPYLEINSQTKEIIKTIYQCNDFKTFVTISHDDDLICATIILESV